MSVLAEPETCVNCGLQKPTHPVEECVTGYVSTLSERRRRLEAWYEARGMDWNEIDA